MLASWDNSDGAPSTLSSIPSREPLSTFTHIPVPRMAAPANYMMGEDRAERVRALALRLNEILVKL